MVDGRLSRRALFPECRAVDVPRWLVAARPARRAGVSPRRSRWPRQGRPTERGVRMTDASGVSRPVDVVEDVEVTAKTEAELTDALFDLE